MSSFLLYVLKSTFCISLLYLGFRTLMRKETFFALNRLLLLTIVVCSTIIPLLTLPQIIQPAVQVRLTPVFHQTEVLANVVSAKVETATVNNSAPLVKIDKPRKFSMKQLLVYLYFAGIFISFLLLIYSIVSMFNLFRKGKLKQMEGFRILIINKDIPAFSFGSYVVISQSDYDAHYQTILAHEQSHIRLNHSFDLMLLEVAKIFHWFNPVIYWLIRDLKAIHEFQADDYTLHTGIDATNYQLLIIQKSVGYQKFALANSFNHCQIKNRITMMNKQKTSKAGLWKVATFLPLLALLLMYCGRKESSDPLINSFQLNDKSVKLDQCFLLFEGYKEPFKFEMNLVGGSVDKNYNFDDTTSVKQLIWLSFTPKQPCWLTDGEYKFSSLNTDLRPWMSFQGNVRIGKKIMDITGGDLICKRDSGKVNITFNLKVDKERVIKGTYSGTYANINRIPVSSSQSAKTTEAKTKIISDVTSLAIVFRKDGNYINDKLYSKEDFITKIKEWTKANPDERGQLSFRSDPGVELSDIRNREISFISNSIGIPFGTTIGVDQQAVFPGGNNEMFTWIKQNIRYPKDEKALLAKSDVVVSFEVNANGKVANAIVAESINPEMDAEALRIVSQMPTWKPALKKGVPVSITLRIGVSFRP